MEAGSTQPWAGSSWGLIVHPAVCARKGCWVEAHHRERPLALGATPSVPLPSPALSPPSRLAYPPSSFLPRSWRIHVSSWTPSLTLPSSNTASAYYGVHIDLRWAVRVFPGSTKPLSSADQCAHWSLTLPCRSLPPCTTPSFSLPPLFMTILHVHSPAPAISKRLRSVTLDHGVAWRGVAWTDQEHR